MSEITAIESFLEITICEGVQQAKKRKCRKCPVIEILKELLAKTKKEKLLRINEKF